MNTRTRSGPAGAGHKSQDDLPRFFFSLGTSGLWVDLVLLKFIALWISELRKEMGREKSPGLKILWIWTIGTAAILVTSVVRTRMQDMQSMMNQNQEQAPKQNQNRGAGDDPVLTDETVVPESDREIAKELK